MDYFGFTENSKPLSNNGEVGRKNEEWRREEFSRQEIKEFRGIAARLNFLSQDSPDLQFVIKQCCRDMANPTLGAFTDMKKVARYLIQRKAVVWEYRYQDPPKYAHLVTDSDWGGGYRSK